MYLFETEKKNVRNITSQMTEKMMLRGKNGNNDNEKNGDDFAWIFVEMTLQFQHFDMQ